MPLQRGSSTRFLPWHICTHTHVHIHVQVRLRDSLFSTLKFSKAKDAQVRAVWLSKSLSASLTCIYDDPTLRTAWTVVMITTWDNLMEEYKSIIKILKLFRSAFWNVSLAACLVGRCDQDDWWWKNWSEATRGRGGERPEIWNAILPFSRVRRCGPSQRSQCSIPGQSVQVVK